MNRKQLELVYLEWFNNYLTIETYADHHGLHINEALSLIELARAVYNKQHPDS